MQTEDLNKQSYKEYGEQDSVLSLSSRVGYQPRLLVCRLEHNTSIREALHRSRTSSPIRWASLTERENSGFSV
ncbi:MAG: hypothetical protein CMA86_01495 [Euryarchaeota archaeon]|nr:hypothetical protein [Euryarchaeota archaeon]